LFSIFEVQPFRGSAKIRFPYPGCQYPPFNACAPVLISPKIQFKMPPVGNPYAIGGRIPGAGRKKGSLSRKTIERAQQAARAVDQAREDRRELSVDALRRFARVFESAALVFQPTDPKKLAESRKPGNTPIPENEFADWDKFGLWADRAVDCHKAILPCETPRLTAIAVANAPQPIAKVMNIRLSIFDAPPPATAQLPAPPADDQGKTIEHEDVAEDTQSAANGS
jgi:hypothetical protein